jgi:hypothetical protein
MSELPPECMDYLKALVEGRQPWSGWPLWFAMHARQLARLLPRDDMRLLREDAPAHIPGLLARHRIRCQPPAASPQLKGACSPVEWALAVCEDASSRENLSRLRQALEMPLSAVADLRCRLPGVYQRGPRDELERLAAQLKQHGLRASVFPAWELDGPPGDDEPDPIPDEEYEVYTAVGHTDLLRFDLPDVTFSDFLGDDPCCREPVAERFRGLFRARLMKHPEVVGDYERKNAEGGRLRKRFRTRGGYQLLSERRRKDLCEDGRVVSLTRVGFGRSETVALVGLSYYGGPLCGFGCFLLLEKDNQGWQVLDRYGAWVS